MLQWFSGTNISILLFEMQDLLVAINIWKEHFLERSSAKVRTKSLMCNQNAILSGRINTHFIIVYESWCEYGRGCTQSSTSCCMNYFKSAVPSIQYVCAPVLVLI